MSNRCCSTYEILPQKQYSLVPITSGEEHCPPNHSWGPGVRSHYVIHYVVSGKGVFYCGTNKFCLKKGQMFVIFPGTIVKYQADESDPWHYIWTDFNGEEAAGILQLMGITYKSPVKEVNNGTDLVELVRQMPPERTADMSDNLKFSAKLYEFMSLLVKDNCRRHNTESDYFETAARYIRAHYYEQITVESIAGCVSVSRKYLYAIFKNVLGISPKDYIINYRVEKAKEFLKDETLSVGSVAYSVGYDDSLNFSKMFKSKTGVSPSEYRKLLKK